MGDLCRLWLYKNSISYHTHLHPMFKAFLSASSVYLTVFRSILIMPYITYSFLIKCFLLNLFSYPCECFVGSLTAKDKEIAKPEIAQVLEVKDEAKKRHLNVVFIGHVGKFTPLFLYMDRIYVKFFFLLISWLFNPEPYSPIHVWFVSLA